MGPTRLSAPRLPVEFPPRTGRLWWSVPPSWLSGLPTPTPGSALRRTSNLSLEQFCPLKKTLDHCTRCCDTIQKSKKSACFGKKKKKKKKKKVIFWKKKKKKKKKK